MRNAFMLKVSVIVPVYNEEKTILKILEQVSYQKIPDVEFEVIVVNDASQDNTLEILQCNPHLYSKIISLPKNAGKGAAVKAALTIATGEYILFQDADLEYNPDEYQNLLLPIKKFQADIVFGSRFLTSERAQVHNFWHKKGNQLITAVFNILFQKKFTDIYTCYFLFRRQLINPEKLRTTGFEQQAEIICQCIQQSRAHYEVPIAYHTRTYQEGKKIRYYHAIAVIRTLFYERFRLLVKKAAAQ